MSRGNLIYHYPLYSVRQFCLFLKYCLPTARQIAKLGYGSSYMILADMVWCNFRYGAMDNRDYLLFEFYRKSSSERNRFFTKRRYFKLIRHFDKQTFISLCDKDHMYEEYKDFIKRDWMIVNEKTDDNVARLFLCNHREVLVKPLSAEQGNGICKISDSAALDRLLMDKTQNPFILEELLSNCAELNLVNPYSLNTLRVYTIVPKGQNPKVISVSLRCGCGKTVVDNWGSGGIGYPVDITSGVIVACGRNKKGESFAFHPDTGIQMVGMKIPYYSEAVRLALDSTKHNSHVLYAGVDIALTPQGPELVELNFPGGHDFLQTLDQVGKNDLMKSII